MAQTTAAVRKTVKFPGAGTSLEEKCTKCGYKFVDHDGQRCPPLPPAKSKGVDEAIAPSFKQQLEDATGVTAAKELETKAAEYFAAEPVELPAEVLFIKLTDLVPSPRNPRSSLGDLKDLAAAIKHTGIQSPLTVRQLEGDALDGKYEIISGHRRHAAAELAELESVPCLILEVDEGRALELNLNEQLQREDLTPLEQAAACRSLQELRGYDAKQMGAVFGQSEKWAKQRLKLNDLGPEARKLMKQGLSIGAALDMALLPHTLQAQAAKHLLDQARRNAHDGGITATQEVRLLHGSFTRPLKEASFDLKREYVAVQAPACAKCPKNSSCGERGLFDNFKSDVPTCTDLTCFNKKTQAEFEEKAEKLAAEGAKVLPRDQGVKLFNEYRNELNYGTEYVDGSTKPNDAKKRTWEQLAAAVPEKFRPRTVVAADHSGALHKLYNAKELEKLATKHAGLKKAPAYNYNSGHSSDWEKKRKAELVIEKRRDQVADQVLEAAVRKVALGGLAQADWELLAGDAVGAAFDAFEGIWRGLGLLEKTTNQREAWVSKGASTKDLQAVLFGLLINNHFTRNRDFEPEFVAMAKRYGCDPKAMMKAQAEGEKSETAIATKKKAKK